MYIGADYDPSDTGEQEPYELDFSGKLLPLERITMVRNGGLWLCTAVMGTDVNAALCAIGPAMIEPIEGKRTSQVFGNFIPGCKYELRAEVITNFGFKRTFWSHVLAMDPS